MLRRMKSERGAAIVEFALVVPILLVLVMGIFEFGRMWYLQTNLSMAARQGARIAALTGTSQAQQAVIDAAAPSGIALGGGQISIDGCPPTINPTADPWPKATVDITYTTSYVTGMFGGSKTLHGKGVMRCNG